LIGINAPEFIDPKIDLTMYDPSEEELSDMQQFDVDISQLAKMGQEATEFVENIVGDWSQVKVRLVFDVQEKDKYGRLLAYVYLPIWWERYSLEKKVYVDDINLNFLIIQSGYATPMTIPPNVKHADLFKELYTEARKQKRGLWAKEEDKNKSSFEEFLNVPSDKPEKPKGLLKYIDQNGVKLDTSF